MKDELRSPSGGARAAAQRHRLPHTRKSITHRFCVGAHEGSITAGLYESGRPGEVFGSTLGGLLDCVGILTSVALQYGVPLEALVDKLSYAHFERCGCTKNPQIRQAKSIVDYVFRWLGPRFSVSDETEVTDA